MNNFSNQKPTDPHSFKYELKTKFQASLALANRFPNGTVFMEEMVRINENPDGKPNPLTIQDYFGINEKNKIAWEKR